MPYYYLIIFIILLFFALIELYGTNYKTGKLIQFMSFFLLFCTSAFKYETGVDWRVYEAIFSLQWSVNKIFTVGFSDFISQFGFEPGYMLFTATIKQFGGDIQTVFFITALVNVLLLYKSLKYFSKYPIFCLLGYYCFVFFILDMSGIRQAIALNIALYGMRFACERKFLKYLLFIFIASTFHQTAFFLLLLYFLFYNRKIRIHLFLCFYGLSLFILLLKIKWLQTVSLLILPLIGVDGTFSEKLVNYVFSNNYDDASLNIVKVAFVLFLVLYVYFYRSNFLKDTLSQFSYMCLIIFGIINNIMFELSEVNSRISAYLIIFVVIVASNIIDRSKIYTNRLILTTVFISYCFLYGAVYILEKPSTHPYYPYQNYILYKIFDMRSTGHERLDKLENGVK